MRKPEKDLPEPELTSIDGMCAMLGCGRSTGRKLLDTREVESVHLFGRNLAKVASIKALIARGGTRAPGRPRKSAPQTAAE